MTSFAETSTVSSSAQGRRATAVARPETVLVSLSVLLAGIIASWPLGVTRDYLNHLARTIIEGRIWTDPDLQQFYTVRLEAIPDLMMDLVTPWLSWLIGPYAAGGVAIWFALVAAPIAGALLSRQLHGRITWLSLAGFAAAFNENLEWGFINYTAAYGVALFAFIIWIRMAPTWRRTAIFAPIGAFLCISHALAFLLLGYLALLWEAASFFNKERGRLGDVLRGLATRDVAAMAPGLLILALSLTGSGDLDKSVFIYYDAHLKVTSLAGGAKFFHLDTAVIVSLMLAGSALAGLATGILTIHRKMAWVCAGVALLVIVAPVHMLGIWGLHFRFPPSLIILTAASITLSPRRPLASPLAPAAIVGVAVALTLTSGASFLARIHTETAAIRAIVADIPRGARVLPAIADDANPTIPANAASLAVIDRSAYVPNLFTNTSPVDVKPAFLALHRPQSSPVSESDLRQAQYEAQPETKNGYWSDEYYHAWPQNWDYILFFRDDAGQTLRLNGVEFVSAREKVVLYRILRP